MNRRRIFIVVIVLALLLPAVFVQAKGPGGGGKPNPSEGAGNNLSYPVIWAEGITKVLRGTQGVVNLGGEYWYQWGTNGTDPNVTPASCLAEQDVVPPEMYLCDDSEDGLPNGTYDENRIAGVPPAQFPMELVKAFIQKDESNEWQAWSGTPADANVAESDGRIQIDEIDWGDNLESVDWTTRSQVRTEVVLFKNNPTPEAPWLEYAMRHTSGWGINEVHGLAASLDPVEPIDFEGLGLKSTVYSPCARLTIQKLLVDRDDPALANLVWVPGEGWQGDGLINEPIFNGAVYEGQDGPGYYSAEINVKGRVIYGYTWNVRNLNEGAGPYRITFSFDATCGMVSLKTYFGSGTSILFPIEEAVTVPDEEPGGGGTAVLDLINNLTYMDINLVERTGGGNGGKH